MQAVCNCAVIVSTDRHDVNFDCEYKLASFSHSSRRTNQQKCLASIGFTLSTLAPSHLRTVCWWARTVVTEFQLHKSKFARQRACSLGTITLLAYRLAVVSQTNSNTVFIMLPRAAFFVTICTHTARELIRT